MSASNQILASLPRVAVAKATAGVAAVTITAPTNVQNRIVLYGVIISGSAAPAATVEGTITGITTDSGGAIAIEIPASAFAPIALLFGTHPPSCAAGTNLVVSVPSLGSGVVCSVTVIYEIASAP